MTEHKYEAGRKRSLCYQAGMVNREGIVSISLLIEEYARIN